MWLLFEHLVQVPPVPHRFPKPAQEGLAYLFHVPWWCMCIFTVSPLLDCTPSHGHCVSFTFWSVTLSAVWFTASIQWACIVAVVQSLNHVHLFVTPWTADQASLSFIISQSLLRLMPIESVMPSNHLVLCHPLLPLLSICPSVWVFSNESAFHINWPKFWSFNFSISPSNEYSGLISFRIDWFDLLAVQGTLKSLLQNHNSKASALWCSAFFMVQLSYLYMTSGKIIALTIRTFVSKVMSLLLMCCLGFS